MILDNELMFSKAQAITTTADSTNVVDLTTVRDIGVGEDLYLFLRVDETMDDSGSDNTILVQLQTDDNDAMTSEAVVFDFLTLPALTAAGSIFYKRISPAMVNAFQRYIALKYTPSDTMTAGKFTAGIVKDIQKYKSYPSGFSIA